MNPMGVYYNSPDYEKIFELLPDDPSSAIDLLHTLQERVRTSQYKTKRFENFIRRKGDVMNYISFLPKNEGLGTFFSGKTISLDFNQESLTLSDKAMMYSPLLTDSLLVDRHTLLEVTNFVESWVRNDLNVDLTVLSDFITSRIPATRLADPDIFYHIHDVRGVVSRMEVVETLMYHALIRFLSTLDDTKLFELCILNADQRAYILFCAACAEVNSSRACPIMPSDSTSIYGSRINCDFTLYIENLFSFSGGISFPLYDNGDFALRGRMLKFLGDNVDYISDKSSYISLVINPPEYSELKDVNGTWRVRAHLNLPFFSSVLFTTPHRPRSLMYFALPGNEFGLCGDDNSNNTSKESAIIRMRLYTQMFYISLRRTGKAAKGDAKDHIADLLSKLAVSQSIRQLASSPLYQMYSYPVKLHSRLAIHSASTPRDNVSLSIKVAGLSDKGYTYQSLKGGKWSENDITRAVQLGILIPYRDGNKQLFSRYKRPGRPILFSEVDTGANDLVVIAPDGSVSGSTVTKDFLLCNFFYALPRDESLSSREVKLQAKLQKLVNKQRRKPDFSKKNRHTKGKNKKGGKGGFGGDKDQDEKFRTESKYPINSPSSQYRWVRKGSSPHKDEVLTREKGQFFDMDGNPFFVEVIN